MSKGNLKYNAGANEHIGSICTYHFKLDFRLTKINENLSAKSPTHKIIGRAPAGHEFEAGVAWEGVIKRGEDSGKSYFTLKFEEPAEAIYNAWPSRDVMGEFYIRTSTEQDTSSQVAPPEQTDMGGQVAMA